MGDGLSQSAQHQVWQQIRAARQERPMVCSVIADMIQRIESLQSTDAILDKLENRKPGDSGMFGSFFND